SFAHALSGNAPSPHFQALEIVNGVNFLAEPTTHLCTGITTCDAVATVPGIELIEQLMSAAVVEPSSGLARVEPKRNGRREGERRILAPIVITARIARFDGPILHGI